MAQSTEIVAVAEDSDQKPAAVKKLPPVKVGGNGSSKTGRKFWAIRNCVALKSPAIFTDWEDCSVYIDLQAEEHDGDRNDLDGDDSIEYKEFDTGLQALDYILPTRTPGTSTTVSIVGKDRGKERFPLTIVVPPNVRIGLDVTHGGFITNVEHWAIQAVVQHDITKLDQILEVNGFDTTRKSAASIMKLMMKLSNKRRTLIIGRDEELGKTRKPNPQNNQAAAYQQQVPIHRGSLVLDSDGVPHQHTTTTGQQQKPHHQPRLKQSYVAATTTASTAGKTTTARRSDVPLVTATGGTTAATVIPTQQPKQSKKRKRAPETTEKTTTDGDDKDQQPFRSYKRKRKTNPGWEKSFSLFVEYKEEFGDAAITSQRIRTDSTKYNRLERWNLEEQERIRDYVHNPNSMSDDDAAKARQLLDAGFQPGDLSSAALSTPQNKKVDAWERNYNFLKEYKELNGDIHLSRSKPGYDHNVKVWLNNQRTLLRKGSKHITADRIQRLNHLGITEIEVTLEKVPEEVRVVYEKKLEELEREPIPSPPGLPLPPPSQQLGAIREAEGDNGNSTSTGQPATSRTTMTNEADLKNTSTWEENFQLLKEYKIAYGTCDLIPNTLNTEQFSNRLMVFVGAERKRIKKIQKQEKESPDAVAPIDKERVQRLLDLGFVMEKGSEAKDAAIKLFGNPMAIWSKKRVALWEANFELLKLYKEQNGGSVEMKKDNEGWSAHLDSWVKYQILNLRRFEQKLSQPSNLDEAKVNRLKELGLTSAPKHPKINDEGMWEDMYEQLKQFKEEHGHITVPHKPKSQLRNWILLQREHYEKMIAGKKSKMTPKRLKQLQEIGLAMRTGERKTWEARFSEWIEYRTKHGKDPPTSDPGLGSWIRKTRRKFSDQQQGLENDLTQGQIDQLNSWDFKWSGGVKKPDYVAPRKSWDERFQDLLRYKEQHGDVLVPQSYPVLGHWVHRQRMEFSRLKRGLTSRISADKIEKLRSIGFVFLTRKSPLENEKKRREIELGIVDPNNANEYEGSPNNDREAYV